MVQVALYFRRIIAQLILRQQGAHKNETKIYTGFEGIKTANEDIIHSLKKGDEWLSMGLTSQPKSWEIYFNKKQQDRAHKGIVQKHLINERYRSLYHQRKGLARTHFRFLPKELEMPTSTEIYRDKVAIMLLVQDNPMAIIIENKIIAESFRKYFYIIWKGAKKPRKV